MTGILFDLDGTLLNTLDDLKSAVNHTMKAFGYPERTREEVRRFVGNGAARLPGALPGGDGSLSRHSRSSGGPLQPPNRHCLQ